MAEAGPITCHHALVVNQPTKSIYPTHECSFGGMVKEMEQSAKKRIARVTRTTVLPYPPKEADYHPLLRTILHLLKCVL